MEDFCQGPQNRELAIMNSLTRCLVNWLNRSPAKQRPQNDNNFDALITNLQIADVILVQDRSRAKSLVSLITSSPWNHTALYLGRIEEIKDPAIKKSINDNYQFDPQTPLVIETYLGQGTIIRPLEFYRPYRLRLCRGLQLHQWQRTEIIRYGVSRLDCDHKNWPLHDLIKLAVLYLLASKGLGKRLFFKNVAQATKATSSTMIAEAFGFIQYPILPIVKAVPVGDHAPQKNGYGTANAKYFRPTPKLFTARDFDDSPYFEIIKRPYFNQLEFPQPRLYPWQQQELLDKLIHYHSAPANTEEQASRRRSAKKSNNAA